MAYQQQSIQRGAKGFLGISYLKKAEDDAMLNISRRKRVLLMGSAHLLAIELHLEVVMYDFFNLLTLLLPFLL